MKSKIIKIPKDRQHFKEVRRLIKKGITSQKRDWRKICELIPELKNIKWWINAYPDLNIIEFIKIKNDRHETKLYRDRKKRKKDTFKRYGIKESK